MKKIKLVMTDLDETLIDHASGDHNGITEESMKVIDRLIAEGVLVVPTTGRYFGGIPDYFHNENKFKYLISSNGAQIMDKVNDEVLMQSSVDKDLIYEIIAEANEKAKNIILVLSGDIVIDSRIFNNRDQENDEFLQKLVSHGIVTDNILDFIKTNDKVIKKVDLGFDDLEYRAELYEKLKDYPGINAVSSHESNIEIMDINTSKGDALLFLQEHLDLDRSEILAIGDNDNDMSMLRNAGIGIAMGNASEEVKSHSDAVTNHVNDNGFAKAIKKYFNY